MKIVIYQINKERDANHVKYKNLNATQYLHRKFGESALFDSSIYDEVFSGEVNCKDLDELRERFKTELPAFHRGRQLSVSDVVRVSGAPELVGCIQYFHDNGEIKEISYVDSYQYNSDIYDAIQERQEYNAIRLSGHHVPSVKDGFYFCNPDNFTPIDFDAKLTRKPENMLRIVAVESGGLVYETEITDSLASMRKAVGGSLRVSAPFEDDDVVLISRQMSLFHIKDGSRYTGDDMFHEPLFIVGDDGGGNFRSLTDEQVKQYLAVFKQSVQSETENMNETTDTGIQLS